MRRLLQYFLTILFFFLFYTTTWAQQFQVEINVEKAYISNYVGDEYGPRIRLYKDKWDDSDKKYALWKSSDCIKLGRIKYGMLNVNKTYYTTLAADDPVLNLIVVTHEERKQGSDDCTSEDVSDVTTKHPDRYQTSTTRTINLNNYAPGVYSSVFTIRTSTGGTYVDTYLKIRYTPVPLIAPKGDNTKQHCANENFTLTTQNNASFSATNTTGLKYQWEYLIAGAKKANPAYTNCISNCETERTKCLASIGSGSSSDAYSNCYVNYGNCTNYCKDIYDQEVDDWVVFSSTDDPTVSFSPISSIFKNNLKKTTSVRFRVRAKGPEKESPLSPLSLNFSFNPPPPNATTVLTEASCPLGSGTGQVIVSGVSSQFTTYRYVLKKGNVAALGCDPDKDGSCLSQDDYSGTGTGPDFPIKNVKPGVYSLFLLNNAGTEGFCPRRIPGLHTVQAVLNLLAYLIR